jgi:hypothetical protein
LSLTGLTKAIEIGGQTMSDATCFIALSLASNRPIKVIYCSDSSDSEESKKNAKRIFASIKKLNASSEYAKNSYRKLENELYSAVLEKSATLDKTLVEASEQTYVRQLSTECDSFSALTPERYTCVEQHAKDRTEALSALNAELAAAHPVPPAPVAPENQAEQ